MDLTLFFLRITYFVHSFVENQKTKITMDRLILPAKEFMKSYFSDGKEKRPSDFDEDIIGGLDLNFMFGRPKWNNTPFFKALGELVDEGVIHFKQLEDGQYVYWMPS